VGRVLRAERSTNAQAMHEDAAAVDGYDIVGFTVHIFATNHDLPEGMVHEKIAQLTRCLLVPAIESRARKLVGRSRRSSLSTRAVRWPLSAGIQETFPPRDRQPQADPTGSHIPSSPARTGFMKVAASP
jgi:hypothetical protein